MRRRSSRNSIAPALGITLTGHPHPPKKKILSHSLSFSLPSICSPLNPPICLPSTTPAMPVFSKIASPDYASTEDDFSVYDLGSFSPPPLQNNRPVPSGGRLGVSHLAEATPVHRHSRHPGSTVSFNHTGAATGFHQRFHHAPGSEDHRSRSCQADVTFYLIDT